MEDISVVNASLAEVTQKYNASRQFFDSGVTKSYDFRMKALLRLKEAINDHEEEIVKALYDDFHRPRYETYLSDIGVLTDELNEALKNLKYWMKPEKVATPLAIFPGYSTKIYAEPKGVVVIFGPWNYPVNLVLIPLIGAVAAGNTVLIKPAHESYHAASIVEKIVKKAFPAEHVTTILGEGAVIGPLLLDNFRFDHIFFTGSQPVGKFIMGKAAEKLTPVTLELGGKNPAIVDKKCRLSTAVNRLVWGKFFNAGQTCIAPDYILVHEDIADEFISKVKHRLTEVFGDDPASSPDFARIITRKRCQKILSYLDQGDILHGGDYSEEDRYIEPTLLRVHDLKKPVMNEEIFGPVWPIFIWKKKEEIIPIIQQNRYPLSCYIYSDDSSLAAFIIQNAEFGNGCINDNMVQFANKEMPFGGIQFSGNGRYHGKSSFDTFSHKKGIVKSFSWLDHGLKYPPYKKWQEKVARFFLE